MSLLDATLTVDYPRKPGVLRDVRISIGRGEAVALVGESGSGKSTLALSLLRLAELRGAHVFGTIRFEGRDIARLSEKEMRRIRGRRIGFVPQSAVAALNPAMTIAAHFEETWHAHRAEWDGGNWRDHAIDLLTEVNLAGGAEYLKRKPRELSVGQAQRILIALGVFHSPSLVIADEPTSALDAITEAEVIRLFARLNRERGMSLLLVTHGLAAAARLAHRVMILREGRVVETGAAAEIFAAPEDPYTRALVEVAGGDSLARMAQALCNEREAAPIDSTAGR